MPNVSDLLSQPRREWDKRSVATENQINLLIEEVGRAFPTEFLDLLRFTNGGYGSLAYPPGILRLASIEEIIATWHATWRWRRDNFPDFLFFGSNGGLESIAFDIPRAVPWPIIMVDIVAGPNSAQVLAPSFADFISAIGLQYDDDR